MRREKNGLAPEGKRTVYSCTSLKRLRETEREGFTGDRCNYMDYVCYTGGTGLL